MNYYNIFLHGFFYEFFSFFFKMVFEDLIFFILSWLRILLRRFFLKTLWIVTCFPTWFLFCYSVSPHIFFKIIFVDFFFNIKLVENLAITFPTCFFYFFYFVFAFFFPKLSSFFFSFCLCFFFQNYFCWFFF